MADKEATLKLTLKSDGFKAGLSDAEKAAKKAGDSMGKQISKGLSDAGKAGLDALKGSISNLKSAVMGVAGIAGGFGVVEFARRAIASESAFKKLAFQIRAGTGEMANWKNMQRDAQATALKFGHTTEEIGKSISDLYQAVGDPKFAQDASKVVAEMATGAHEPLETMTNLAGGLNEKFGITAQQLPDVLASVVSLGNKGGVSVGDLADKIGIIGANAKGAGLDGEKGFKLLVGMLNIADNATGTLKKGITGVTGIIEGITNNTLGESLKKNLQFDLAKAKKQGLEFDDILGQIIEKSGGSHDNLAKVFAGDQLKVVTELAKVYQEGFDSTKGSKAEKTKGAWAAYEQAIADALRRFDLLEHAEARPQALSLGIRQRLQLAAACLHRPEVLILDEPTSGVDPAARDLFWRRLVQLSRQEKVTIFVSTHFMNEAERCDRMSMMHAGKVLDSDVPAKLVEKRGAKTLEEAFIGYLIEAEGGTVAPAGPTEAANTAIQTPATHTEHIGHNAEGFSLRRMLSYLWREALELQRDPVRATLALGGSLLLMFAIGFGITLDVEDLSYAVLDRDQTTLSQSYTLNLAGSRYFTEHPPIVDYEDLDRRMRSGELSLAIEIPAGFARDVLRGQNVQIGAWLDGAMPQRAETVQGYVQGMHQHWLLVQASERGGASAAGNASVETRFRYNPDVKSLPAMVPAVIPLLLLMLPAMLTALAVVREKETGSITNLYVTPVTRIEFLLGKQLPYVGLAMVNFLLMSLLAVTIFGVPVKGSFLTLALAALIFSFAATGMGLLASAVTRSQIAAMFFAMIGTLIPATQFAGLIDPVSSLEGSSKFIGEIYPATHMISISRGVFSKALGLADLTGPLWSMLISVPVILGVAVLLLKKQER